VSKELEQFYYYESGVDCETEYPDQLECCKNFYYYGYATVDSCPDWQTFAPTQCYSSCDADWWGFEPWYLDCTATDYNYPSYYLWQFYDSCYYGELTTEEYDWMSVIDELYYDLETALDSTVGYDANQNIKPATDLSC